MARTPSRKNISIPSKKFPVTDGDPAVLADRIGQRLKATGQTQRAAAAAVGRSERWMGQLMSGTSGHMPAADVLARLARVLGTTSDWLLGYDTLLPETAPPTLMLSGPAQPEGYDGGMVALVEVAGSKEAAISELEPVNKWIVPAHLVARSTVAPPDMLRIVPVLGDSAAPLLLPGTRVLVDLADRNPASPGLFLIRNAAGYRIMRLEYLDMMDPPVVRCIPVNPAYTTFDAPPDRLQIEGRVKGHWAET